MPIASEVQRFVLLFGLACVVIHGAAGYATAAPFWLLFVILAFIFRDFRREVPSVPLANVSPIDGYVTAVGEATDPFLQRSALHVRVQQNWFGEFNLHGPIEGKVQNKWYPGSRSSGEDRRIAVWIKTDEGDDVVFAVDVSAWAQYVRFKIRSGERVGQGQRCGLALFARPVDLYLPITCSVNVAEGQRLKAGSDIIAKFVRKRIDA